jgi:hypothetical protein
VTGFLILGRMTYWDTAERDDHSCYTLSKGPNLDVVGWVCSGKVAQPGVMLVVGSVVAVVAHFAGSFAKVVAASERWVYASEATSIASRIEDAAFALAPAVSSSMVT